MKFKKGDTVRVRKDLVVGETYGRDKVTNVMKRFGGKIVTIEYVDNERFLIKEETGVWDIKMIENYIQLIIE